MPSDSCGQTITTGDQWKVISKLEDGTYLPDTNCNISFKTGDYERFYIRVTGFNIEESRRCEGDRLFIYNIVEEDGQLNKNNVVEFPFGLCGETKSLPNYYYTKNDTVMVEFITDGTNAKQFTGFELLLTPYNEYKYSPTEEGVSKYNKLP